MDGERAERHNSNIGLENGERTGDKRMSDTLTIDVPGVPVAKGSAKAFVVKGRAIITQTNRDKQKPWASAIAYSAMQAGAQQIDGPVSVSVTFWMPRPKSHYGAHGLKPRCLDELPAKKPDVDKLVRCVLDALTGVCWADDAQVCSVEALKCYELAPERGPGACITVSSMRHGEAVDNGPVSA